MPTARGSFDVTMRPDSDEDRAEGTTLGTMVVEKRFHGDLDGTGRGRMLTGMTPVEGSAGYVLIERVRGRLQDRRGSFLLQHSGILDRGTPRQVIEVVPDSGTDDLTGLSGRLTIQISEGAHAYTLEYTLPRHP